MTIDAGHLKVLTFSDIPTLLLDRHKQRKQKSRRELRGKVNNLLFLVMV